MLDSFTQFWFSHLDGIVNVLFLVLILLFLILFVIIFVSSRNKKHAEIHGDDLEKTLRKVLESAELRASPMPMPSGNSDVSAEASAEVEKLKKSINDKVTEIDTLKKQIVEKQSSGTAPAEDVAALQLRLKELEAKLTEYEIIEDDIANLSMYKEENKRLRSELDKLQGTVTPAVDEDVAEEDEVEPTPETAVEPVVASQPAPTPPQAPAPTPTVDDSNDDDIMGEFVQAVAEQGTKENPKEAVTPVAVAPAPAPPTPVVAPVASEEISTADDIMAEFEAAAASVDTSAATTAAPATDSTTDDIMAEFEAAVDEKEKQSPAASALEESTDTDKILNEMDSLINAPVTEADDDKDPTEKLIGEFETLTKTKS